MSTKRLSRTVLEAGQWRFRWHYSKCASRSERSEARVKAAAAERAAVDVDELYIRPRKPLGKMFASDKLGAVERWLLAQVGRPWAKIEGEIRSRFDTRSLAGRHIVFDHLLPNHRERRDGEWVVNRRYAFHVDRHGFLRARQRAGRKQPARVRRATIDWLAGRKIVMYGAAAYWLIPVAAPDPTHNREPRFRQTGRLDSTEIERLEQLYEIEREAFVVERLRSCS